MTIHGLGYRPLHYEPTPGWARLWPVAAIEFRALLRRWPGILVFILFLGPHIGSLGFLLVQLGVWQIGVDPQVLTERMMRTPRLDARSHEFYLNPVLVESFVLFLAITSLVSCRAIAKDRQTDALEIFWTRGIGPRGYFLAKWFGSVLLVGTGFVAAPVLLWGIAVLMAPDWQLFHDTVAMMPRVVLALLFVTMVLTWLALAFSALARNANQASILWFALMAGSVMFGRLLAAVFRGEYWCKAVSPWDASKRVAEWICGITPRQDYDPRIAAAALAALVVALTAMAVRRLRTSGSVAG